MPGKVTKTGKRSQFRDGTLFQIGISRAWVWRDTLPHFRDRHPILGTIIKFGGRKLRVPAIPWADIESAAGVHILLSALSRERNDNQQVFQDRLARARLLTNFQTFIRVIGLGSKTSLLRQKPGKSGHEGRPPISAAFSQLSMAFRASAWTGTS